MSSLDVWRGEFGTEYTDRQPALNPRPVFDKLLAGCEWQRALEVGCNRGDNLMALCRSGKFVAGIDPNDYALREAVANLESPDWSGWELPNPTHSGAIPYGDGTFDLVFTAGVLIHIGPKELDRALYEIHRVSRRYILSIEYEGDGPIEYRGIPNGIWKRDYGQEWLDRYPLTLVEYWPVSELQDTAFDGCSAWLLDRRPPVSGR